MSAESFLSSAVEAAVGMAGFAGIVAAIRHRDIATWSHADRLLLRMLLVAAAMAITFALLPAVLAEAGLPAPTIWRTGSLSLMLWQIAIAARRSLQFRARRLALPFSRLLYAWVAGIISAQTLNLFLGASWPYLLGIFSSAFWETPSPSSSSCCWVEPNQVMLLPDDVLEPIGYWARRNRTRRRLNSG